MTTVLDRIGDKLTQGQRLARDDAAALWETRDLIRLGMLADDARRQRHGTTTTFVRVAEVDVAAVATATVPPAAGDVQLLGDARALHAALDAIARFTAAHPEAVVTAGRLDELMAVADPAPADLLRSLREAGVTAIASAAVDRLADPVAAVGAARDAGLPVARFVVERPVGDEPWTLLSVVGELQRATGSVRTFAPLARQQDPQRPTTGYADVKIVALARLWLNDVPSIQVDWSLHGPKLAQVALLFGADDIDGVSPLDAGDAGRRRAPLQELLGNIRAASLVPRERDARFRIRDEQEG